MEYDVRGFCIDCFLDADEVSLRAYRPSDHPALGRFFFDVPNVAAAVRRVFPKLLYRSQQDIVNKALLVEPGAAFHVGARNCQPIWIIGPLASAYAANRLRVLVLPLPSIIPGASSS